MVVRTEDNGKQHNEVKSFSEVRTQKNPFATAQAEPTAKPDNAKPTFDEVVKKWEADNGEEPSEFIKDFLRASMEDDTGGENGK